MGQLTDGKWGPRGLNKDEHGRFVRAPTTFRSRFERGGRFEPEAGRYHLYAAHACPWAHRVLIARALRKLDDVLTVDFVDPFMGEHGWTFSPDGASGTDSVLGKRKLWEVYVEADPHYTGRVTVPTVWDRQEHTIVNNESREIIRDLSTAFMHLGDPEVCLAPAHLQEQIDTLLDDMYDDINNGVYKCGFARTQSAYDEAVSALFSGLDRFEARLSESGPFLLGPEPTEADICLFTTLFRFDIVYFTHFKCNLRRVQDYPGLWAFVRRMYARPGVAQTCHEADIRSHYFRSHESINPHRIVPVGPAVDFRQAL